MKAFQPSSIQQCQQKYLRHSTLIEIMNLLINIQAKLLVDIIIQIQQKVVSTQLQKSIFCLLKTIPNSNYSREVIRMGKKVKSLNKCKQLKETNEQQASNIKIAEKHNQEQMSNNNLCQKAKYSQFNNSKIEVTSVKQIQSTKKITKQQKIKNKHFSKPIEQILNNRDEDLSKQNKKQLSNSLAKKQKNQVKGKLWSQLQYILRQQIVESLKRCNFSTMLPVQQASIPLLLKNYDLAVQAQTGSGKTLSFLIPLLQKYLAANISGNSKQNPQGQQNQQSIQIKIPIRYLIVSPTRQLCQQTFSVLARLIKNLPSKQRSEKFLKFCHCATGGSDMVNDIQKLKNQTVVLVGTVGRIRQLSEHMDQNWLKKVEYLYIDQADRVLKQKGIEQLIRSVQKIRRTAMFSATLQTLNQKNFQFYGMRNLAKISLKQTVSLTQNTPSTSQNEQKKYIIPKSLTNTYVKFPSRLQKLAFLTNFIHNHIEQSKVIVFFNTCASVDFYTKLFNSYFNLKEQDQIVGLHGKLKTNRRQKLIKKFLQKSHGCLFATDVVSRGIDFDHIHFIVQIDPPEDPDNYVHRIGRTARINRPGTAILLIEQHQQAFINYLAEKSVGVQQITNIRHYYGKNEQIKTIQQISQAMDSIMRTDRDYVQKSKKAFVSYIRSYKEHDLRYIFEFKNLDIGKTAHSFFMYRIPRIKQILGKSISSFTQSQFDTQQVPWLDKNQQLQYLRKKQKRQAQLLQKKKIEKKILKNADAHNNKSKRKRIKAKLQNRYQETINKQHRQLLKSKLESSKSKKRDNLQSDSQENYGIESEDTEQIEQRMLDDKDEAKNKIFKSKSQLEKPSKRKRNNQKDKKERKSAKNY